MMNTSKGWETYKRQLELWKDTTIFLNDIEKTKLLLGAITDDVPYKPNLRHKIFANISKTERRKPDAYGRTITFIDRLTLCDRVWPRSRTTNAHRQWPLERTTSWDTRSSG
jgi:hypothetical protein